MNWYTYLAQQSVSSGQNQAQTETQQETKKNQDTGTTAGLFGGDISFWVIIGGTFVVMYFLMIRPQRKEEKRKQDMLKVLSKGDPVVTTSGIIGTIASVKEDTITLNVGNGTKMEFLRSAIGSVRNKENQKGESGKKADKKEK